MYVQSDLKKCWLAFSFTTTETIFLACLRPLFGSLAPKNMSVHFSAKTLYVFIDCRQKRSYGTIWIGLNMLTSYQSISLLLHKLGLSRLLLSCYSLEREVVLRIGIQPTEAIYFSMEKVFIQLLPTIYTYEICTMYIYLHAKKKPTIKVLLPL